MLCQASSKYNIKFCSAKLDITNGMDAICDTLPAWARNFPNSYCFFRFAEIQYTINAVSMITAKYAICVHVFSAVVRGFLFLRCGNGALAFVFVFVFSMGIIFLEIERSLGMFDLGTAATLRTRQSAVTASMILAFRVFLQI